MFKNEERPTKKIEKIEGFRCILEYNRILQGLNR